MGHLMSTREPDLFCQDAERIQSLARYWFRNGELGLWRLTTGGYFVGQTAGSTRLRQSGCGLRVTIKTSQQLERFIRRIIRWCRVVEMEK